MLACPSFLCTNAQAPPQGHDATTTILRIEGQWLHARSAEDAARFLAPDFIGVNTHGIIETREQRLAHFRPAPRPPATSVHFEQFSVSFPAPAVAIATGEVVGTGSRRIYVVAFSDTFCRRHGEWLAVNAEETLAFPPSQ
jgi:hypothetical protein